ncbi:MAG: DUF6754 domain-containing protein [Chloroflexota bacterium]
MSILVYVIILVVLVATLALSVRARSIQLRRISAYTTMPLTVGEAVESEKTIHISFGNSAVRDGTTIAAIASAEILYSLAERAAVANRPPLVTVSDPVTLTLGQDTLRRAYKARNGLKKYHSTMARWYPQGPQSMAFAAGAGAAILDEGVSTNVLVGRFGPELMLLAENAVRYDRIVIAQSDQVNGQAVAYALSDSPLIGEELYAGAAYLGRSSITVGGVIAQDIFRFIVIALMIGLFFLALVGAKF